MKKQKIFAALAAAVLFTLAVIVVVSCRKEKEPVLQQTGVIELNYKSQVFIERIKKFEKKMKMYRDNPGLKSDENKYVLDAILDWEATLNYNYCYSYVQVSEVKSFDTIMPLPLIEGDSMTMVDVSDRYYNAILAAVQRHYYVKSTFTDQKLLTVDLEPADTYDSVIVTTYIGNTQYSSQPPYDWIFGEMEGTCDGYHYGESDAAKQCAIYVRNAFYEEPPDGHHWFFPNPITIHAKPLDEDSNGNLLYENPNDDSEDNYLDYLIYYASENVNPPGLNDVVKCVEYSPELSFYKQSSVTLTQGWINNSGGMKFKDCQYDGFDYTDHWQHELSTTIGIRLISADLVIELPPVDE